MTKASSAVIFFGKDAGQQKSVGFDTKAELDVYLTGLHDMNEWRAVRDYTAGSDSLKVIFRFGTKEEREKIMQFTDTAQKSAYYLGLNDSEGWEHYSIEYPEFATVEDVIIEGVDNSRIAGYIKDDIDDSVEYEVVMDGGATARFSEKEIQHKEPGLIFAPAVISSDEAEDEFIDAEILNTAFPSGNYLVIVKSDSFDEDIFETYYTSTFEDEDVENLEDIEAIKIRHASYVYSDGNNGAEGQVNVSEGWIEILDSHDNPENPYCIQGTVYFYHPKSGRTIVTNDTAVKLIEDLILPAKEQSLFRKTNDDSPSRGLLR